MTNVSCSMYPGPAFSPTVPPAAGSGPAAIPNQGHIQPGLGSGPMMQAPPPSMRQAQAGQSADSPSMRDLLTEYLGHYIRTEHLVGTGSLVNHEGRLIRVCDNAFVLEEQPTGFHQVCDYYSLKFFREF